MDTPLGVLVKALEDENWRFNKMYLEEKLKAETAKEYLAKKWSGRLAAARWPKRLCNSGGLPFGCVRCVLRQRVPLPLRVQKYDHWGYVDVSPDHPPNAANPALSAAKGMSQNKIPRLPVKSGVH
jgi:hypothetical protein